MLATPTAKYESVNPKSNIGADCYAFSTLCSLPLPFAPGKDAAKIKYKDFFGHYTTLITPDEHASNLKFLRAHVRTYFEFPPLYDGCAHLPKKEPRNVRAPREASELLSHEKAVELFSKRGKELDPPSWYSHYPPYVELRTKLNTHLLKATTPWRLNHFAAVVTSGIRANNYSY